MMPSILPPLKQFTDRIPGRVYLWLAVPIFGASSALTRKITEIGAMNSVGGHNPISLCNVLFVGNLCALFVLVAIHRSQWHRTILRRISQREWVSLIIVAILAGALAPGLIFQALAWTPVTNVVLLGRLEPLLTLALSIWLLGERVDKWQFLGAVIAFIGVILTLVLHHPPQTNAIPMMVMSIGWGELLTVLAAISLSMATIVGKQRLVRVPVGIYHTVRTGVGTLVFFCVAQILYGRDHFLDVLSPLLWRWMLLYGGLIVVVGQSLWTAGLRAASVATASIVGSFTPIFGILAAYLILGEVPTLAQCIGGSVILFGVCVSRVGIDRRTISSVELERSIDSKMGFKGI